MDFIFVLLVVSIFAMITANIRVVRCSKLFPTRIIFLISFLATILSLSLIIRSEFSVLAKFALFASSVLVLFNYTSFRSYNFVLSRRLKTHAYTEKMKRYRWYVLRTIFFYLFISFVSFEYFCFKVYDIDLYLVGVFGLYKFTYLCALIAIVLSFILLLIFKNRFFEKGSKGERTLLGFHNVLQLVVFVSICCYVANAVIDSNISYVSDLCIILTLVCGTSLFNRLFLNSLFKKIGDATGMRYALCIYILDFLMIITSLSCLIILF